MDDRRRCPHTERQQDLALGCRHPRSHEGGHDLVAIGRYHPCEHGRHVFHQTELFDPATGTLQVCSQATYQDWVTLGYLNVTVGRAS